MKTDSRIRIAKRQIVKIFKNMGVNIKCKNIISNPAKTQVFTINLPLKELRELQNVDWAPMKYQRGFVSNKTFVRGMGKTIIGGEQYKEIPPIHLRLFSKRHKSHDNNYQNQNIWGECLDGLQRVVSSIDKLFDERYTFSKGTIIKGLKGQDIDVSSMNFKDIEDKYPKIFDERYNKLTITIKLYYDITDIQAMELFSKILNVTNTMTTHIIRSASEYTVAKVVRSLVRLGSSPTYSNNKKEFIIDNKFPVKALKMFKFSTNPDSTLKFDYVNFKNENLVQEQAVACMLGYFVNEQYNGKSLDKLYKDINYKSDFPAFNEFKTSIQYYDSIVSAVKGKTKYSKHQLIKIYALVENLRINNCKIKSSSKFMQSIIKEWYSILNKKTPETNRNQFSLDQNKDSADAISRSLQKLLSPVMNDFEKFGVVKIDKRRSFSKQVVEHKLSQQDNACPMCNSELHIDDLAGGHIAMWSYGGDTNITNCKAIHFDCNKRDHFKKKAA